MRVLALLTTAVLFACAPVGFEARQQMVRESERDRCEEQWLFCQNIRDSIYRQNCEEEYNTSRAWGCTEFPMPSKE